MISLSREGIAISGGIGDLEFEHLKVKDARFDVFFASKLDTACARSSRCAIAGSVEFCGIQLDVNVITEIDKAGDFFWTVYGEVKGEMSTSALVEELKRTFLDISLNRLALIATKKDTPSGAGGSMVYPVAKGFQFCAMIDDRTHKCLVFSVRAYYGK